MLFGPLLGRIFYEPSLVSVTTLTMEGFLMSGLPKTCGRGTFSFSQIVASFLTAPGLPFSDVLSKDRFQAIFARCDGLFGRKYTTAVVLWAFMGQVLRDGKEASCKAALSRIASHLGTSEDTDKFANTHPYCQARSKLPQEALRELTCDIGNEAERSVPEEHLFKGRHAKLIDGSTFMMPDTEENQRAYPQNSAQKPGLGFPIARFVTVFSLATACVIDAAIGKYKGKETGETALLRQLLSCFQSGDIAVADRYYGNYWMIALFMAIGVDVCFRVHQCRRLDFRKGKRLGKNDRQFVWKRPNKPPWMSRKQYEDMPRELSVRVIRYVTTKPGRRQKPINVVTTLTHDQMAREDISELYGFRWNSEINLMAIKTHLNLHHLRCKSPEMIHREFWVTLLAYNAIRTTILSSSILAGVPPWRISFVSCCQTVLSNWDMFTMKSMYSIDSMDQYQTSLLQIGKCLIRKRPGRFEPRVIKKRKKNYNLMSQPRSELKEKLRRGDNSFEKGSL